jgi:two-component system, chemotaxis family, CheB/CheR fusion protein
MTTRALKPVVLDGSFFIVGIGASAGGLEAIEAFLHQLPPQSGLAFIVVQHLDPTHKGMMVELLARATTMKVSQVKDRSRVEPNHVYVIPPNTDLSILHGVLHLLAPLAPRGLRLPIDFFFRSLAADQKTRGIGVVLSGMGSDGTLGLAAIKEQGGAVFVQAPTSAKFDAMPRSAIDTGLADAVVPVEELPARILAYSTHAAQVVQSAPVFTSKTQSAIEKICVLLRNQTGHDFSQYKKEHRLPPHRAAHGFAPDRRHRRLRDVSSRKPSGNPAAL